MLSFAMLLAKNQIKTEGGIALAKALESHTSLKKLSFCIYILHDSLSLMNYGRF